jgi:prevent-host-death family protein
MMTMKQTISPRRLGVAEAKSKLSSVLRDVAAGPTIIHSRGHDVAVLLAIDDYVALAGERGGAGAAFLERIDAVKRREGGGVDAFEPARLDLRIADPFANGEPGRRTRA